MTHHNPWTRVLVCLLTATLILILAACGEDTASDDPYRAAGVLFVNSDTDFGEQEILYATQVEQNFTFDLDAALVYYFTAADGNTNAGDQGLVDLRFGQNEALGVTADGRIAYRHGIDSDSELIAYYLKADETGLYFKPQEPIDRLKLDGTVTIETTDFPGVFEFFEGETVATVALEVVCDASATRYAYADLKDYQLIELPAGTERATVRYLDASGAETEQKTVTPEHSSVQILYDDGGLILDNKIVYFDFPNGAGN